MTPSDQPSKLIRFVRLLFKDTLLAILKTGQFLFVDMLVFLLIPTVGAYLVGALAIWLGCPKASSRGLTPYAALLRIDVFATGLLIIMSLMFVVLLAALVISIWRAIGSRWKAA